MRESAQDVLRSYEQLLDSSPSASEPTVEINTLRRLAARGIPSSPPHIRPLTYSLLLGTLGRTKAAWPAEANASRARYGELTDRFLTEITQSKAPQQPLSANDKTLDSIAKDVRRTQASLHFFDQPISANTSASTSTGGPLRTSPASHRALANRLALIASAHSFTPSSRSRPVLGAVDTSRTPSKDEMVVPPSPNPSIVSDATIRQDGGRSPSRSPATTPNRTAVPLPRLDFEPSPSRLSDFLNTHSSPTSTPSLAVTSPTSPNHPTNGQTPSVLVPSVTLPSQTVDLHSDALVRILYVFSLIHPHLEYTQGFSELLAPLYWTYAGQGEPDVHDAEHAEADAFWGFVALMAEVGDVVKGPGEGTWGDQAVGGEKDVSWAMRRLSKRVQWADAILWEDLHSKSLDPALPYYSFRWISTMLAQDFPLLSLLRIWDSILSEPLTTRAGAPKVDLLLDICTSMLLLSRKALINAGRRRTSQGLWEESSDGFGEFGEGFVEGMAILQRYPVEQVGGIENVLDLAFESRQRRLLGEMNGDGPEEEDEAPPPPTQPIGAASLAAARRYFVASTSNGSIGPPDGPASVEHDFPDNVSESSNTSSMSRFSSLRRYAESFKESDTAAALSKRSSNLTAAALARWGEGGKPPSASMPSTVSEVPEEDGEQSATQQGHDSWSSTVGKLWHGSVGQSEPDLPPLPVESRAGGSLSPRPEFKEPPPSPPLGLSTENFIPPRSPEKPAATPALAEMATPTRSLQDRLSASLATKASPIAELGVQGISPKPLLLASSARRSPSVNLHHSPAPLSLPTQTSRPPWADSPISARSPMSARPGSPTRRSPSRLSVTSDSDTGSITIPIGGTRRRSINGESSPAPARTTFLKTSGVRLRDSPQASPAVSRPHIQTDFDASSPRSLPRSPRSKGLGRPESMSSNGGSDSEAGASLGRLSRLGSGEGSQRGWTLQDPGSIAGEADANDLPPLFRESAIIAESPLATTPSSPIKRRAHLSHASTSSSVANSSDNDDRHSTSIPGSSPPRRMTRRPTAERQRTLKPSPVLSTPPSAGPTDPSFSPPSAASTTIKPLSFSPSKPTPLSLPYAHLHHPPRASSPSQHSRHESSASDSPLSPKGPRSPRKRNISGQFDAPSPMSTTPRGPRRAAAVRMSQQGDSATEGGLADDEDGDGGESVDGSLGGGDGEYGDLLDAYAASGGGTEEEAEEVKRKSIEKRRVNRF